MCETDVYIIDTDGEKLFAKEVASMSPKQNGYIFVDIYGRKYEADSVEIVYIDFIGHRVILRRLG